MGHSYVWVVGSWGQVFHYVKKTSYWDKCVHHMLFFAYWVPTYTFGTHVIPN